MYLQYIAIAGALFFFVVFFFYFMKRRSTLKDAHRDPNKSISKEYDAIGRSIVVDKQGQERHV